MTIDTVVVSMSIKGLPILVTHVYPTRTADGNYLKNICQSIQKRRREGKREEKKLEWQLQSFLRYTETQKCEKQK